MKIPTQVPEIQDAKKILCRHNNTYYINSEGKLFVIGSTDRGVNGNGRRREDILEFKEINFETT